MTSITILRGYSASGKSTWARESGKFIVSRDIVRQQLTGRSEKMVLSPEDEKTVTYIETEQVRAAIKAGKDVVIDDTNLVLKFARRWVDLAVELGVEWSVRDFPVDWYTCSLWNNRREDKDRVPQHVIESQGKRFPLKQWQAVHPSPSKAPAPVFTRYVPDTSLPKAVGFDLDGTLAHIRDVRCPVHGRMTGAICTCKENGRSPYDESRYHEDMVDDNLRRLTWSLSHFWDKNQGPNYKIIVFSGRSEEYRDVCEAWLRKNAVHFDLLVMRKEGDKRRDDIVKAELFDQEIAPNYNFLYHFDDRQRVVDGLRSKGITVYQVAEGNF